jgi:hypothetical protein
MIPIGIGVLVIALAWPAIRTRLELRFYNRLAQRLDELEGRFLDEDKTDGR